MQFSSLVLGHFMAIRRAPVDFCGREKWSQNRSKLDRNRYLFQAFFEARRNALVEFPASQNMLHFSRLFASFWLSFHGYPQCSGGILWLPKMDPKCIQNGLKSMLFCRYFEARRNAPVEISGVPQKMQK